MKTEVKTFFVALILIIVGLSIFFPYFLPDKFYFDANYIVEDRYEEIGFFGGYPLSILFYSITGLRYLPYSIVALIQLSIMFMLLYFIGVPRNFNKFNVKNIVIYFSFLMVGVFIGQPSKEFITFVFSAIIILYFTKYNNFSISRYIIYISLLFFIFGFLFRPYYIFIPIIAIVIFLINSTKIKNKNFVAILFAFLAIIFLSSIVYYVKGDFLTVISRENINITRINLDDENAETMILSPIAITNIFEELLSIMYGFITVNFPINGFKFYYKPQVLAFIFWQIAFIILIFKQYFNLVKQFPNFRKELWIMCLLLAYFIMQGVFEPDLGSAIRHKIGILPFIYYIFYYNDFRKQI